MHGLGEVCRPVAFHGISLTPANTRRNGRYKEFAWGFDELKPVTKKGKNWLAGGATIVDALSTLKVMGMEDEFQEGLAFTKVNGTNPLHISLHKPYAYKLA
eukprot:SAG31_NODE_5795_length_2325_cov_1.352201_4_plen_101_part_00